MSADILILPTFSRPEFLWFCLDHLAACPEVEALDIWVVVDAHINKMPPLPEIQRVLAQFKLPKLQMQVRTPHKYHGNSFNLMTAYREAYLSNARYVFMVEDDVMVAPTFFQWHYLIQDVEKPACSIGVVKTPLMKQYASLGVCFPREVLAGVVEHYCHEYFENMRGYCLRTFPKSPYEFEQDGLWCRVLEGKKIIWAKTPQAQHVGWYGYHRPKSIKPTGTVEQRYQHIKMVLQTPERLKRYAVEFQDVHPLNLLTK